METPRHDDTGFVQNLLLSPDRRNIVFVVYCRSDSVATVLIVDPMTCWE